MRALQLQAILSLALASVLVPAQASADCFPDYDTGIPCGDITPTGCCQDESTALYCGGTTLCQNDCLLSGCGWESAWDLYDCTFLEAGESDPSGAYPFWCDGGGGGGTDTGQPCGGVTWEGCCDGQTLFYCLDDALTEIPCSQNESADGQFCGWVGVDGYDCTDAPAEGSFPRACPGACTPDCAGRSCGGDGCGGSCGTCPAGSTCNVAGVCELTCAPQCGDRVCGPDPVCGVSCGACAAGLVCNTADNACVASCTPSCAGKECGDNGCGGACGVCAAGSSCRDFRCVSTCVPSCGGNECGSDGCGGTCGACDAGESCQGGVCVGCVADCSRRQCGPDGCGGTCGTCSQGQICDAQYGLCMTNPDCIPQCSGRDCGPDGCGGMCGSCGIDFECYEGHCVTCVPQCDGRQCGDDGCGAACGQCAGGAICGVDGRCVGGTDGPDAGAGVDGGAPVGPPVGPPGDDDKPGAGPDDPTGAGSDEGPCPIGTQRRYGVCVAGDLVPPLTPAAPTGGDGIGGTASGCNAGGPGAPLPWLLLLLVALVPAFRRRA